MQVKLQELWSRAVWAESATETAGDIQHFAVDEFDDTRGQLTGTVPEFNASSAIYSPNHQTRSTPKIALNSLGGYVQFPRTMVFKLLRIAK
jgi:hypothetical protein